MLPDNIDEPPEPQSASEVLAQIEQPAKVIRIAAMILQLLSEVRAAPLDEAGRIRLTEIYRRSLEELENSLGPELVREMREFATPLPEGDIPSEPELRIMQSQLVGWLEGLFQGLQVALAAQQMSASSQLANMRKGLPPGPSHSGDAGPYL